MEEPDRGRVFDQTNGEKIRVDYENVFSYSSKNKGKTTVVELGWGDNKETYILDIEFEDFDDNIQANRKAWRDYYRNGSNSVERY